MLVDHLQVVDIPAVAAAARERLVKIIKALDQVQMVATEAMVYKMLGAPVLTSGMAGEAVAAQITQQAQEDKAAGVLAEAVLA